MSNVYAFTSLTGGAAGALDALAGAILATGDLAFGVSGGKIYAYKFDSTSEAAEASPGIIAPDSGDGRWLLAVNSIKLGTFTRAMGAASGDVAYTGVGFKPTAIIFLASLANKGWSVGFDDGTVHCALFSYGTGPVLFTLVATSSIYVVEDATPKSQGAIVKTLDADGFTLTWAIEGTPATANATVYYLALR